MTNTEKCHLLIYVSVDSIISTWSISSISKVCDDFEGDKNGAKYEEGDTHDPNPMMSNTEAQGTAVKHSFTCKALAGITDRTFQN